MRLDRSVLSGGTAMRCRGQLTQPLSRRANNCLARRCAFAARHAVIKDVTIDQPSKALKRNCGCAAVARLTAQQSQQCLERLAS